MVAVSAGATTCLIIFDDVCMSLKIAFSEFRVLHLYTFVHLTNYSEWGGQTIYWPDKIPPGLDPRGQSFQCNHTVMRTAG